MAHSSQNGGELEMDLGASVAHIYIWWLDSLIFKNGKSHSLKQERQAMDTCLVPTGTHFMAQPSLDRTRCTYGFESDPLLGISRSKIIEGSPFSDGLPMNRNADTAI